MSKTIYIIVTIVDPFKYPIGRESWDDTQEVDPDAFVVFYFSLAGRGGKITIPNDYPKDKEYGNPMIPEEVIHKHKLDEFCYVWYHHDKYVELGKLVPVIWFWYQAIINASGGEHIL